MSKDFQREKKFKSTKEVYGIDPMVLADMTYKEAEILKYIHAKRMFEKSAVEMFKLPLNSSSYEENIRLDAEMKKYGQAADLAALHLQEIGVDYSKIIWREE